MPVVEQVAERPDIDIGYVDGHQKLHEEVVHNVDVPVCRYEYVCV